MIAALVTFAVLYGLLYWLERSRTEVDAFSIGTVAAVPVLLVFLVSIGLGFLYPEPIALAVVSLLTLVFATFALLLKLMGLSAGRSAAYTTVVLVLNIGLSFLFGSN